MPTSPTAPSASASSATRRALRCGHVFHAACLAPWFAGGIASNAALLCPLCKQDVKDAKAPDDVEAPKAAGDADADGDAA